MITWRLWRDMQEPQTRHPLFRIARRVNPYAPAAHGNLYRFIGLAAILSLFLIGRFIPSEITLVALLLVVFSPILMMVFNGTVLGLFWSVEIAMTTRRWIRNHDADLWQTIPEGALSVAWQGVIGRLYRDETFSSSYRIVQGLLVAICFLMVIALLFVIGSVLQYGRPSAVKDIILTNLPVLCVGVLLYFDHIQSVMLGCLIGMYCARTPSTTMEMVVRSGVSFGIVKGLLFLLIVLLYATMQNLLLSLLGDPLGYGVSYILLPMMYMLIHELVLRGAYHFAENVYEGA